VFDANSEQTLQNSRRDISRSFNIGGWVDRMTARWLKGQSRHELDCNNSVGVGNG